MLKKEFLEDVNEVQKEAHRLLQEIRAEIKNAESSLECSGYLNAINSPERFKEVHQQSDFKIVPNGIVNEIPSFEENYMKG